MKKFQTEADCYGDNFGLYFLCLIFVGVLFIYLTLMLVSLTDKDTETYDNYLSMGYTPGCTAISFTALPKPDWVTVNSEIQVDKDSFANIDFTHIETSQIVDLQFEIVRKADKKVMYSSEIIKTGDSVEKGKLLIDEKGKYACIVNVYYIYKGVGVRFPYTPEVVVMNL